MNIWAILSSIIISLGLAIPNPSIVNTIEIADNQAVVTSIEVDHDIYPHKLENNSYGVKLDAVSAAVMDETTGTLLWQKDADQVRSIASITKLMSMMVFLDHNPGWEELITMQQSDELPGNSPDILRGETVTIRQLFNTALISSDNNSVNALVRSTGLDKSEFVKLMNNMAIEFGLDKTSFIDPTGLSAENISTARQVLSLADKAFDDPDVLAAVQLPTYSFTSQKGKAHKIYSTDWLLNSYLKVEAGKTGYIPESGYNLVTKVRGKSGQAILTVVLGAPSNDARYNENKILSAWTLDNYSWY